MRSNLRYQKIAVFVLIGIAMISGNVYAQQDVLSPLKQFESGIAISDVKCKENYILVVKESNERPSCVKSVNVARLLSQGWLTVAKYQSQHSTMQLNKTETLDSKPINSIASTNKDLQYFISNNNTDTISKQTVTNITSSVIEDIIRNIPHQDSDNVSVSHLDGALVRVNAITSNKTLYFPTIIPLPEVTSSPTIVYSTMPSYVKIISVGMSPNPLKVGDKPQFTVTYQNISDKPITHPLEHMCCLWMAYSISPTDKVQEKIFEEGTLNLMADGFKDLQPNQIVTDPGLGSSGPVDSSVRAWQSPSHAEYQITKPGMITVTMNMWMAVDSADLIDTIQFNVNATQ